MPFIPSVLNTPTAAPCFLCVPCKPEHAVRLPHQPDHDGRRRRKAVIGPDGVEEAAGAIILGRAAHFERGDHLAIRSCYERCAEMPTALCRLKRKRGHLAHALHHSQGTLDRLCDHAAGLRDLR
eukprot:229922-Prymnesium_polylepis.2